MNVLKTISIFLMILFLFIIQKNFKNYENFITWYLPFYNQGTVNNVKSLDYITSNVYLNQLEYDYINGINFYLLRKEENSFLETYYNFIFKNILASMKLKKLFIKQTKDPNLLHNKVNENNFNLSLVSAPYILETLSKNTNLIKNINSIIEIS